MILRVPGDKSITQRALILAALADGESRLRGLLHGADPHSTARAMAALGAGVTRLPDDGGEVRIRGRGLRGLSEPSGPLDLGNSGTGTRLLLGVLAGEPLRAVVDGDASLRARPMERVTRPLTHMGADFRFLDRKGHLPLEVRGGELAGLEYEMPVASAQVKSALLLAGVVGGVPVLLTEPGASRDHTERMLREVGVSVLAHVHGPGRRVELRDPPERLLPLDFRVPGDLSSAAFLMLAGLLGLGGGELTVTGVGLNPTRAGVVELFRRMGGQVSVEADTPSGRGEPVGSVTVRASSLHGIDVGRDDVVAAIDEIPAVAVAAARAEGVTRISGARELRVKETDRIRALVTNLRAVGVVAEELEDGLEVEGTEARLAGEVDAFHDHRIAMVFGILAALPGNDIRVRGRETVEVSYPGFWETLEGLRG